MWAKITGNLGIKHLADRPAGPARQTSRTNARAQVESTAVAIPQVQQQEAQRINAISLLGQPPETLQAELGRADLPGVPHTPPSVPVGLPSELARRRPDIRQAEAQLHAATAEIGVAKADFYPKLTLSGSAALQATQLKNLGLAAQAYSIGPSLMIPIFEGVPALHCGSANGAAAGGRHQFPEKGGAGVHRCGQRPE